MPLISVADFVDALREHHLLDPGQRTPSLMTRLGCELSSDGHRLDERKEQSMKILLIEDNAGDVQRIRELLAEAGSVALELECADRVSTGLARLAAGGIDVVLLDLTLPESKGLDILLRVHAQADGVPIVVLTDLDDETLGLRALQEGAQDYLVKGQVDGRWLGRALRYAIERQQMQTALNHLSLDELTGLYNYRGFFTLGNQHVRLACRSQRNFLLVFVDFDGLKEINDTFGHLEGNRALIQTAEILRKTFRGSDILARLGGDEFAVLTIDADESHSGIITARLQQNVEACNRQANLPYALSLSVGVASFDPRERFSIEKLMADADAAMYQQKRSRWQSLNGSVRKR